tara:strand:- start:3 stop:269 length:267 start_codon:yes stop_codon:yes gene_type:complete
MVKNIFSVLIFLFCVYFFYFIASTYLSNKHQKKISINRETILKKINNNIDSLPILVNDTNDVIEFNSGFQNDNIKIKRNFWNLFKKND